MRRVPGGCGGQGRRRRKFRSTPVVAVVVAPRNFSGRATLEFVKQPFPLPERAFSQTRKRRERKPHPSRMSSDEGKRETMRESAIILNVTLVKEGYVDNCTSDNCTSFVCRISAHD